MTRTDGDIPQHRPDSDDQFAMGQVAGGDIEVLTMDQAKALAQQWRDEDEAMDAMMSDGSAEDEQPALNSEANSAALLQLLDDEDDE